MLLATHSKSQDIDGFSQSKSVSTSGDMVAIGDPWVSSDVTDANGDQRHVEMGAVFVFVRYETQWIHQAQLVGNNTEKYDSFGWSVSIEGDTIVVSAKDKDSSDTGESGDQRSGAASQSQNAEHRDEFGYSASISGDTIVVGARYEASGVDDDQSNNNAGEAGAAYVFAMQ
jgi:hypothetical protein